MARIRFLAPTTHQDVVEAHALWQRTEQVGVTTMVFHDNYSPMTVDDAFVRWLEAQRLDVHIEVLDGDSPAT
ncbi:hypothetical protein [Metallibacterium sp.]|uniref:hypothetical protein n=1 Tax=Metallibacterium sp. TaxID=2940281 RepID=UPI00260A72EE|nr:hypothetical protein [Metallibacterium sp.]